MPRQSVSLPHINNNAVRNTTTITTSSYNLDDFGRSALIFDSTLDQIVNIVAEYSRDNVTFKQVGAVLAAPANPGFLKVYTSVDLEALKLINGYIRFKATAAVTPTTGNLTLVFQVDSN